MEQKVAATIIESSGKTFDHSMEPGIFDCLLEHEIKSTKAIFDWRGPKITVQQWEEMLAFFRWTYDTHKSEAQVRLFIHPELGWKIWAFPQAGGTSMTTKEVDNEDSKLQRAAIGEGYIPFGTVHHHCSMGAFQSGTDRADENSVDGLHITIGHLDEPMYDMHCRLYIRKNKFEPVMSSFWDVGEDAMRMVEWIESLKYNTTEVLNREARAQMCTPPSAEVTFPDLWKTNYILPAPVSNGLLAGPWCWHCQKHTSAHTPDNCPEKQKDHKKSRKGKHRKIEMYNHNSGTSDWWDEKTWSDLMESAKEHNLSHIEVAEILTALGGPEASPFIADVIELASDNYKSMAEMYALALEKFSDPAEVTQTSEERIEADKKGLAERTEEEIIEFYQGQRIVD